MIQATALPLLLERSVPPSSDGSWVRMCPRVPKANTLSGGEQEREGQERDNAGVWWIDVAMLESGTKTI